MKNKNLLILLALAIFSAGNLFSQYFVRSVEIDYHGNLRGDPVVVGSITTGSDVPGTFFVDFDGICISSPGDRIRVAASNQKDWGPNDGAVSVEAYNDDVNRMSFSHTRAYVNSGLGKQTFYAIAENTNTGGSGSAYFYGRLVVRFFPDEAAVKAHHEGVATKSLDLRTAEVTVASHNITADKAGKVLVRFNGYVFSDKGDRIILAASNKKGYGINDGHVQVLKKDDIVDRTPFSHTRVYSVKAGKHTFYAMAVNSIDLGGSGKAYIYGSFSVIYVPDGEDYSIEFKGVTKSFENLRGAPVALATIPVNTEKPATAIATFDGMCFPSFGDLIALAASDKPFWGANEGNVAVEKVLEISKSVNFSHTMAYEIAAGKNDFYAVGQNYVEEAGNGEASIYGSLLVQLWKEKNTGINPDPSSVSRDIVIWPNPVSETMEVSLLNFPSEKVNLEIYDIAGRKVKSLETSMERIFNINVSDLRKGSYFLKVGGNDLVMTKKFLVL